MKDILIVGASSGIGACAAKALAQAGHRVHIADIKVPVSGGTYIHLDISDTPGFKEAIASFHKNKQSFDALVITAAMHSAYPSEYMPDELVERVMRVNLIGHMKFVRDMIPLMKNDSRIIAVSSIAAGIGIPMESLYSASKAGLELFYESLSVEIAYRGIHCCIIAPGNVNTGFNEMNNDYVCRGQKAVDGPYEQILKRIDSRLGMPPEEVARVIIKAIQSPKPRFSYVVGQNALKAHWAKRLLGRDLALSVMKKFFGI